jgi:hypothetical protein
VAPGSLEDPQGPEDVHVRVVVGPLDRRAHVGLGGEMEHEVRPHHVEDRVRVPDVPNVELGAGGDVSGLALREVVEDVHLVAARDQRIGDV